VGWCGISRNVPIRSRQDRQTDCRAYYLASLLNSFTLPGEASNKAE
jgi:hypothetical protein